MGTDTRSFTGSGRWRRESSVTLRASCSKASQSLFDSQQGGTAAWRGWMKVWRSVVLRSSFSSQVAAGRTTSEYSALVSIRKLRSTTRSSFPRGASSRQVTSVAEPFAASYATEASSVPR